uniref:CLAVATA3/ESR (CLE)-related protein 13 n=1 Tax=Kalanchoe fedtschenkoi TaxID=63787 RepID=A0A7N0TZM9_KALFE
MSTKLHSEVHLPLTFLCLLSLILLLSSSSNNFGFIILTYNSSHSQDVFMKNGRSSSRSSNRKLLESRQFDYTPFLHHLRHPPPDQEDQHLGGEFDPVNAMDKRLVPTGPNPLHH